MAKREVKIDRATQMVVLRGRELNAARKRASFTIDELAEVAGVGYTTAFRALHYEPLGIGLAEKIVAALGVPLSEATATDDEGRPADGISPDAWQRFTRLARIRIRQAIRQAHREVASEASRRCWFWPSQRTVQRRLVVRQRTASGEMDLL